MAIYKLNAQNNKVNHKKIIFLIFDGLHEGFCAFNGFISIRYAKRIKLLILSHHPIPMANSNWQ